MGNRVNSTYLDAVAKLVIFDDEGGVVVSHKGIGAETVAASTMFFPIAVFKSNYHLTVSCQPALA